MPVGMDWRAMGPHLNSWILSQEQGARMLPPIKPRILTFPLQLTQDHLNNDVALLFLDKPSTMPTVKLVGPTSEAGCMSIPLHVLR